MKNTIQTFKNAKYEGKKLSMLTAYDYSIAKIMDECDFNRRFIRNGYKR